MYSSNYTIIMRTIDDVFIQYQDDTVDELNKRINRIESRLIGLNEAVKRRAKPAAIAQPLVEIDGGFNKKNYRRSIKRMKSRKLRSRR